MYIPACNTKKETGHSSNLKRGNKGIINIHKKYRRQDRDPG